MQAILCHENGVEISIALAHVSVAKSGTSDPRLERYVRGASRRVGAFKFRDHETAQARLGTGQKGRFSGFSFSHVEDTCTRRNMHVDREKVTKDQTEVPREHAQLAGEPGGSA